MTTVAQLLRSLRDKDVNLWLEDDQLMFDAPEGALGPGDIELIRHHKPEIIELLAVAAPTAMAPTVEIVDRSRPQPSSLAQIRMWSLACATGAGAAYNVQLVLSLRGALDVAALRAALDAFVARHEAWRTVFSADGATQTFAEPAPFPLPITDLGGLAPSERDRAVLVHAREDARTPFDLRGGPLARGHLIRMSATQHLLFLGAHHIITDCRSMEVAGSEIATLYSALHRGPDDPLASQPFGYADFAAWQRRSTAVPMLRDQLAYWTRQLSGVPGALTLPTDRPRPMVRSLCGASYDLSLSPALSAELRKLARNHDVTLSMVLHAGWAALLARLSGQHDVMIGVPVANRQRPEIQNLVGLLVNTIVLRSTITGATTAEQLLAQVKETTLAAHARQELAFEQIAEAIQALGGPADPCRNPVFQAMFAFALQSTPQTPLRLPGVTLLSKATPADEAGGEPGLVIQETEAYVEAGLAFARRDGGHLFGCGVGGTVDVSLSLRESDDRIVGGLNYAADLFDRTTVERWGKALIAVLTGMAATPDAPLGASLLAD